MLQAFLEKHQIQDKQLAVAVSGGSDSLALALMAAEQLHPLGYRIVALTVNHQLRESAAAEAEYVAKVMREHGIEHHILVWTGEKPVSGVEEAAREARYRLLSDWCAAHGVSVLLTAHHLWDQAETFLMRLQRGSGLDGLCGMTEQTNWPGIKLLRPFLYTSPLVMKDYLQARKIKWVEDESNRDDRLLRVKARKILPLLSALGITPEKITATMQRLQSSQEYLNQQVQKILQDHFQHYKNFGFSCKQADFAGLNTEMQYRLLALILRKIGQTDYQPRAALILNLAERAAQPNFKAATLGHCRISAVGEQLWFWQEKAPTLGNRQPAWKEYVKKHPELKKIKMPAAFRAWYIAQN